MSGYYEFSYIYDLLMSHLVDYEKIAEFIDKMLARYAPDKVNCIIETGCGGGNVTVPLAKLGYNIKASDISCGMVENARKYVEKSDLSDKITLETFDMTDMPRTDEKSSALICLMDSLNHIEGKENIEKFFIGASASIASGGLLIFDVNSQYKFEKLLRGNAYTYNLDEVYAVWQNDYDSEDEVNRSEVTFFCENDDGTYNRFEEDVYEYYYSVEFLERMIKKHGFELIKIYDDFTEKKIDDKTQRWVFIAGKI